MGVWVYPRAFRHVPLICISIFVLGPYERQGPLCNAFPTLLAVPQSLPQHGGWGGHLDCCGDLGKGEGCKATPVPSPLPLGKEKIKREGTFLSPSSSSSCKPPSCDGEEQNGKAGSSQYPRLSGQSQTSPEGSLG